VKELSGVDCASQIVLVPFAVVYSEAIWGRKLLNLFVTLKNYHIPTVVVTVVKSCQKLDENLVQSYSFGQIWWS